jgi:caffeoyl-CoA O-methyltransferase
MPSLLPDDISQYIQDHTSDEGDVLKALDRRTYTDVLLPQMLSGKVQGRFLSVISKLMKPKNILEIGTFTGYAALCMSEGLSEGGRLITIDINEELEDMVQSFVKQAGKQKQIQHIIGNALEEIPKLNATFDLVFIDADKINYSSYYDLVIDKVRSGGLILADNVLWSGKIVADRPDKDTAALRAFNKKVTEDSRVENVLLSIRDGIMMIYKK